MSALLLAASLLAANAHAEQPCATFYAPVDVVAAALRLQGAATVGIDGIAERRTLLTRLACVSEPLEPGDAVAVHLALGGERPAPMPAPSVEDAQDGPPHPDGGVALVDGVAYAALRSGRPAVVQAFDADGRVVYTRWLDVSAVASVRAGEVDLPTAPTLPRLPPVPLRGGEVARLVTSSALVVASGALFLVAADARSDWYALKPSPVETVEELEQLRVRTNVAQGAGLACAGLGAAGLLSVAVRVPF
ncbi:MAG: hypothetical protein Q8P41_19905 [Pseudomonadota bacterium]|nr:hypothetical protein [Pseudomonadota bacterium]